MRLRDLIVAAIGSVVAVSLAHAQQLSDRQKGRILARQVCAECHAVGRQGRRSPNSEAPSFVAVASTPGMTEMARPGLRRSTVRTPLNLIRSVPVHAVRVPRVFRASCRHALGGVARSSRFARTARRPSVSTRAASLPSGGNPSGRDGQRGIPRAGSWPAKSDQPRVKIG